MNEYIEGGYPLAYLITLRTYGTWLHGDRKGSVDRHGYNIYDTPRMFSSKSLRNDMREQMSHEPLIFNKKQRLCVLEAIKEVYAYRGYECFAINIRTNHLHTVVSALQGPNKIVNDFKSYATRRLRVAALIEKDRKVWARGKSRRYLWKPRHVELAVDYVLFGQGGEIPDFD